jgi:hypothetical protein
MPLLLLLTNPAAAVRKSPQIIVLFGDLGFAGSDVGSSPLHVVVLAVCIDELPSGSSVVNIVVP